MAKYFQRIGATKVNFLIQIKILSIEAKVMAPTVLSVVWTRGPSKEETTHIELTPD